MEFVHVGTGILLEIDVPPAERLDPIVLRFSMEAIAGLGVPMSAYEIRGVQLPYEIIRCAVDETEIDRLPAVTVELIPKTGHRWARYASESRPGESRWQPIDTERFPDSFGAPQHRIWGGVEWTIQRDDAERAPLVRVREFAVSYGAQGAPVSHSLPRLPMVDPVTGERRFTEEMAGEHRVFRHPDGTVTDKHGRPLVRNREEYERQTGRTGATRHEGPDSDFD